ncbi:hypothetical protein C6T53_30715 [Burkholderia multivorans]|nr:hypothetical protein C6T53_30715 [Burkholderia multivorans]
MTRGKRQIAPILRVIIGLAKIYQKITLSRDIGNISSISNRAADIDNRPCNNSRPPIFGRLWIPMDASNRSILLITASG